MPWRSAFPACWPGDGRAGKLMQRAPRSLKRRGEVGATWWGRKVAGKGKRLGLGGVGTIMFVCLFHHEELGVEHTFFFSMQGWVLSNVN